MNRHALWVAPMVLSGALALPTAVMAAQPTATTRPLAAAAPAASQKAKPAASPAANATPRYLLFDPETHLETAIQTPKYPVNKAEGRVHVWGDHHAKRAVIAMTAPKGTYAIPAATEKLSVHGSAAELQRSQPVPFNGFIGDASSVGVHWVEQDLDVWVATVGTWSSAETAVQIANESKLQDGRLVIATEPGLESVVEGAPSELTSLAWGEIGRAHV